MSVAALTVCMIRMPYRLRLQNQRWRQYNRILLNENRWRAMRYGHDEGLIDLAKGKLGPFPNLLEEIIELVSEDAKALGCWKEVLHTRKIIQQGTSADRQLQIHEAAVANRCDEEGGLG